MSVEKENDNDNEIPGVVCFKRGALVTGFVEQYRCLNLGLGNLYKGFYTLSMPVMVEGVQRVMECRFQIVPLSNSEVAEPLEAAELMDVVSMCAELGEMVRVPVVGAREAGQKGRKGEV